MATRIMIVEDDDEIAAMYQETLAEGIAGGLMLLRAKGLAEALAKVSVALTLAPPLLFDCIFTDGVLTDGSGPELAIELRRRNIPIPVVLITGNPTMLDYGGKLVKEGILHAVYAKPSGIEEILEVLHRLGLPMRPDFKPTTLEVDS